MYAAPQLQQPAASDSVSLGVSSSNVSCQMLPSANPAEAPETGGEGAFDPEGNAAKKARVE